MCGDGTVAMIEAVFANGADCAVVLWKRVHSIKVRERAPPAWSRRRVRNWMEERHDGKGLRGHGDD